MPTDDRIRSAMIEVAEQLEKLGYKIDESRGPVSSEGEFIPEEEIENTERIQYYLIARAGEKFFYILFDSQKSYATVVYPFNVLKHLGQRLSNEEVEAILDEEIDWEDLEDGSSSRLHTQAADAVIENTPPEVFHQPAFNLSIYASSAVVDYRQTRMERGFPREFQSARGIFPYTERMTLSKLDDRVDPVIIAGERGRRYVEYSFIIDKEDKDPQNYEFVALF